MLSDSIENNLEELFTRFLKWTGTKREKAKSDAGPQKKFQVLESKGYN